MTLPKSTIPTYTVKLPSSGKDIKYRPFLVKEEKAIMIAFQDKSDTTIYDTIKAVVSGCTYDSIDVDNLPLVDLEYLFLQLRIKSKGSLVDVVYKCNNTKEDGSICGTPIEFQVDLNDAFVDNLNKVSNNIMLEPSEKFGVILKYPTLSSIKFIEQLYDTTDISKIYGVFANFIDTIYKDTEVVDVSGYSQEDLVEWIESLTDNHFTKIKQFFESLPRLKYVKKLKCSACGNEDNIEMIGLKSFLE